MQYNLNKSFCIFDKKKLFCGLASISFTKMFLTTSYAKWIWSPALPHSNIFSIIFHFLSPFFAKSFIVAFYESWNVWHLNLSLGNMLWWENQQRAIVSQWLLCCVEFCIQMEMQICWGFFSIVSIMTSKLEHLTNIINAIRSATKLNNLFSYKIICWHLEYILMDIYR